jgi:hypothetical protein
MLRKEFVSIRAIVGPTLICRELRALSNDVRAARVDYFCLFQCYCVMSVTAACLKVVGPHLNSVLAEPTEH